MAEKDSVPAASSMFYEVEDKDLCIFNACFCFYMGLDMSMPMDKCILCAQEQEMLCVRVKGCLKPGLPTFAVGLDPAFDMSCPNGVCCTLSCPCCQYSWIKPAAIKARAQCLCSDVNCAFPFSDEIPKVCALYGIMCFPAVGFCNRMSAVRSATTQSGTAAPPAPAASA